LLKTTPGAASLPSDAFRQGLAARSDYLGDPTEPKEEGNPANWKVGGPGNEVDALIVVAGNTRPQVDERVSELAGLIEKAGLKIS
jgi:hypothetical protein